MLVDGLEIEPSDPEALASVDALALMVLMIHSLDMSPNGYEQSNQWRLSKSWIGLV